MESKPKLPPYEEQRLQREFEMKMEAGVDLSNSPEAPKYYPPYAELATHGQERLDRAKASVNGFFDRTRSRFGSFFGRIRTGGERAAAIVLSTPEIVQQAKEQGTAKAVEIREEAIAGIGRAYDAAGETVREASRELTEAGREVVTTAVDTLGNGYKAVEGTVVGAYTLFANKIETYRRNRRARLEMPSRVAQMHEQMSVMARSIQEMQARLDMLQSQAA